MDAATQPLHIPTNKPRVGCWWSEKKSRKFSITEFSSICKSAGLEAVKIDLDHPLETQGPFAAIIHKLSDVVVKADRGDTQALSACRAFEEYLARHPQVAVIDPLHNVRKLLDRYRQYKLIEDSELGKADGVFTPTFTELNSMDKATNLEKLHQAGVQFPFVCKPSLAHGCTLAHKMALIFNEESLRDISPPCVAQTFINHNAILYKLFVVGRKYFIIERPSLKNFTAGDYETIFFDTHDISKPNSVSSLTELDKTDQSEPVTRPEKERLDRIVDIMSRELGLSLFGVDVIIEKGTGRYAIIDMNNFPGYDGVDNILELLCSLILEKIEAKETARPSRSKTGRHAIRGTKDALHVENLLSTSGMLKPSDMVPACLDCILPVTYHAPKLSKANGLSDSALDLAVPPEDAEPTPADRTLDDSGIDTSDSSDEKRNKKQPSSRVMKRQHSRSHSAQAARCEGIC